ncbi:outer membrane receptor protein involved in Fe transport [Mucilaginibacter gracilis]|uniref:Outer membrane receptor protein involved in Fe transport n=1 Tax=Mucilaginibacter gracilis TaxID=423350 RepID=A0A495J2Y1_9SPHI|nr:TonB-dependent receptor [Mucilaginibacter gracilis]RKR82728.1 outer membrane receptor protein involved in Fe transport [Mucilaginibacter gracilis]
MKIKYLILYSILFFASVNAFAQSNNGSVSGKLTDPITGEMIDFAGVAILNQGTEDIVKSGTSNNGGAFKFTNLPYGKFSVRITYIGYEKQTIDDIEINAEHTEIHLGIIKLKKSGNAMAEVTVSEKKRIVEFGADQINYNVSQSLQSEGATATDILKNVPMVSVDIDGNATISGKRNTRIFIDGKPSDYMTSNITDLLNVLPSDAIEKIEVMTNPPAKYSADGEGIINIVLKKGYKLGLNGTLSLSAGTLGNYNVNTYASYKGKTFSLSSSYAFGKSESNTYSSSLSQNFLADTNYYRNQYGNRSGLNYGHNIREGVNWDIDTTQNLRVTANLNINRSTGASGSDYLYFDENNLETKMRNQGNSNQNQSTNYSFDADYTWKRTNGDQLEASATYSANTSANNRFAQTLYLDANDNPLPGSLPLNQLYDVDGRNKAFQFKIDYDKPLGEAKRSTFNFGASANLRTNNNNQDVQGFNFTNQVYLRDTALTNNFVYNEHIYSSYASLTLKTENKWQFRIGGRSEFTDVNFSVSALPAPYNIKPYISFFPNLSASKNYESYSFGVSYSGRIGRPNIYSLNPQVITNTSNPNISFGNPGLSPSYTQQLDLSFSVFGHDWAFYPRIGFANTTHIIERITTPIANGAYQTTYDNLGSSSYNTINLYGNYRINKKINLNGGGTLGHMVYQSSNTNSTLNRNGFTFQGKAGVQADLPAKTAFESNFNYYTNTSAQGRNKGSLTSSFAMRKSLYKNKFRVRLMITNPLGQSSSTTLTQSDTFNKQDYYTVNTRNYSMSVSYNFTKVGNKKPLKGI